MKKITLILSLCLIMLAVNTKANDDFSYDLNIINTELAELNQVEKIILENENQSIIVLNQQISENLSYGTKFIEYNKIHSPMQQQFSMEEMDWGSFAWGFCCCPIGFFTVAISKEKDSAQKASYWIGVGVSTVFSLISSAITAASGGYAAQ
jgi:hypothetical protein